MPANNTVANKTKAPTLEELDGQVLQIRDDIASLTKMLSNGGASKADELSNQAKQTAQAMAEKSQEAIKALNTEAGELEAKLMLQVRKKPLAALGIAVGAGFLAAMLVRK
ncbi:DUF883 family protein [Cohaesibacter celericrescens]|uniref:DUF883 domain-containing protein n=1 Tax=Cohaesibacter celericrescens TaxID=2067669 RepID=A0A2N5XS45_9HYPH|nr:DUF883 C-terminal domain-containing protein [Cohaesibacter celericrescens]PLW77346.1 hypothetical protein C0081_08360 [Cohaesibacter celericrescens]